MNFSRRNWLVAGAAMAGSVGLARLAGGATPVAQRFAVEHSEAEWRALLTPQQFAVLRQAGTELAFSSPLDHEMRSGTYSCAACDLDLFTSACKFDSGTGWPSFWKPIEGAIGTTSDTAYGMVRTEVHCARCGGHLGHVFDDGPPPTGLRYCMNGVALHFRAQEGKS